MSWVCQSRDQQRNFSQNLVAWLDFFGITYLNQQPNKPRKPMQRNDPLLNV